MSLVHSTLNETVTTKVVSFMRRDLPGVACVEETSTSMLLIDTAGCGLNEMEVADEQSKGNEGGFCQNSCSGSYSRFVEFHCVSS